MFFFANFSYHMNEGKLNCFFSIFVRNKVGFYIIPMAKCALELECPSFVVLLKNYDPVYWKGT
jgi:hypothetical protein